MMRTTLSSIEKRENYKRRKKEKEQRIQVKNKKQEERDVEKKMEKENDKKKILNCHRHASKTINQGKQNGIKKFLKQIKIKINTEIDQKKRENAEKDKEIQLRKKERK